MEASVAEGIEIFSLTHDCYILAGYFDAVGFARDKIGNGADVMYG
jgi:hypothetical protein